MTRVLVDCDGVVADYTKTYVAVASRVLGQPIAVEDVTTWEFRDCLGLSAFQERRIELHLARDLDLPEFPGAVDALREFRHAFDVVFVTSPHPRIPHWTHERARWLEARFPGAPVIHTSHKAFVGGDVLIDDRPENIRHWLEANPEGLGILWARPYNADGAGGASPVVRTNDWGEAALAIDLWRRARG